VWLEKALQPPSRCVERFWVWEYQCDYKNDSIRPLSGGVADVLLGMAC